ncbi:uncharacterized protein LOC111633656 [Centruroides sculpturatus]|uniref:uncharacterized protein LOC111633656 n=1 Tax=Centruroides sculpturatus TaxID=218467 RepID=UPI000C6D3D25|nr:uncharacterized protein LOC111633656 [Centruroides sculpturatus]
MDSSHRHQETAFTFTCLLIGNTVLFTSAATICLSLSLLTNYWEHVTFDISKVQKVADINNHSIIWTDNRIARINVINPNKGMEGANVLSNLSHTGVLYLVSLHGGVHSLCPDVTVKEKEFLQKEEVPIRCYSYLAPKDMVFKNTRLDRMRNLAMSCAMVSLILLASSALVGTFGLAKRQISAIMVTGVMFILAALFGTFTLAFMYFKRLKPASFNTNTVIDNGVPQEYLNTRVFTFGWSASLGWSGITLCVITSILWLLLARVLRYQVLCTT